jgi:hypothetical protein
VFVDESYETVAETGEPPLGASVKLELVIVEADIDRENVALTAVFVTTAVAPEAGEVDVTVGGGGGPVVKLQLTGDANA